MVLFWSSPRMVPRLLLMGLFLGLASLTVSARVFTFEALDCRCEIPDSWIERDVAADLVNASDSTHHEGFALRVIKSDAEISLAPSTFTKRLVSDLALHGFNLTAKSRVELAGLNFLKVTAEKDLGNRTLRNSIYFANANGFTYRLEASEYNDSPDDDTQMQGIVNSFAFLRPPQPDATTPFAQLLNPPGTHPPGFFVTYYMILGLVATAVLLVLATVVGGIGFGIYLLVKRRS